MTDDLEPFERLKLHILISATPFLRRNGFGAAATPGRQCAKRQPIPLC
jgi:hypothetical protein